MKKILSYFLIIFVFVTVFLSTKIETRLVYAENILLAVDDNEPQVDYAEDVGGTTDPDYSGETTLNTEDGNTDEVVEVTPDKNTDGVKVDDTYNLLAPIGNFKQAPKDMGDYFRTIFELAIALCAVLAVIMIVIGGIQYMGNESIFGKTEAKSKIMAAIGGLLIALGAYALLNTINPDLLGGGGVTVEQVSAEIEGDVDAPVVLGSTGTITPNGIGIICNKSGGFTELPNIVKSFDRKMTYSQEIPKGQAGPNNTIKYDCSGFVSAALQCAGINKINGGTATIFSGSKAEKITTISGTSINNIPLQIGDLVGWVAGGNEEFGHVMIYIGGGVFADSHGGKEGRKPGGAYGQFSIEKYKNRIKYIVRTSKI